MSAAQYIRIGFEVAALLLALLAGIAAWKYMSAFFRLMFFQLLTWICFYVLAYGLTIYQQQNRIPPDNQWLMNIHMLIEGVWLFIAAMLSFRHKAVRGLTVACLLGFLSIAFGQMTLKGPDIYLNYADVAECILLTVLYSGLLYKTLIERSHDRQALVLLISGLLLYFACSIPMISLLHIMQEREPQSAAFVFDLVNGIIANTRYFLMAAGFFVLRRNHIH